MTSKKDSTASQPKRKKATRACFHCQKAHLTCDDARPCQRCIKRGLSATCQDGVRKKAKYLQDAYDTSPQKSSVQSDETDQSVPVLPPQIPLSHLSPNTVVDPNNPLLTLTLDPSYNFGSEAANLEYSILSNMLQNPSAVLTSGANPPLTGNPFQSLSLPEMRNDVHMSTAWGEEKPGIPSLSSLTSNSNMSSASAAVQAARENTGLPVNALPASSIGGRFSATVPALSPTLSNGGATAAESRSNAALLQQPSIGNSNGASSNGAAALTSNPIASKKRYNNGITQENVYKSVSKPYAYTEGYHYLVKYAKERFERDDVLRIVRALAMFRPSFIALLVPLTEEDLTFIEKCFQRTLLEFEKLISFSGTPTVVWRRTGEICVVGKEFSLLTQWSREQLLGKKTYIYELMDTSSAVEYWEKFATHAFENTTQSVLTTCILLTPQKRPVPCTFCFTIKRDIFDVPLAIVGNFLPILS